MTNINIAKTTKLFYFFFIGKTIKLGMIYARQHDPMGKMKCHFMQFKTHRQCSHFNNNKSSPRELSSANMDNA